MITSEYRILVGSIFVSILLAIALPALSEDKEQKLIADVFAKGKECAEGKSGTEVVSCYVKATPSKCQSQVYRVFSRFENKMEARRAWYLCISTCADAGFWSRKYGECARDFE
ncbi:MAG: hypothetical protein Q8L69_12570 [Gallionellaceae bacterium]|nr:hypothetical protein [Gallionellaceae bacterium]